MHHRSVHDPAHPLQLVPSLIAKQDANLPLNARSPSNISPSNLIINQPMGILLFLPVKLPTSSPNTSSFLLPRLPSLMMTIPSPLQNHLPPPPIPVPCLLQLPSMATKFIQIHLILRLHLLPFYIFLVVENAVIAAV